MRDLQQTGDLALRWVRPARTRRAFELWAEGTPVATLAWVSRSQALGQWAGGQYRFSFEGWFRPRALVYDTSAPAPTVPLATLSRRTGALTFTGGSAFQWKKPARLTSDRDWLDAVGQRIVRFSPKKSAAEVAVTISVADRARPEAPALLLLGQCLLVVAEDEAIAATTAALTAVIASG